MVTMLTVPVYYPCTALMRILLIGLARWQVRGKENVPAKGPLIIVSNHLHAVDPPLLGASIPRRIAFMAKDELFNSWLGTLVRGFGAFPVRRNQLDRQALSQANAVLKKGLALGIFPEGERSRSSQLQPGLQGAAHVALRSGAPILPVGITGMEKLKGFTSVLHRPEITVTIGHPFTPPSPDGKVTKDLLNSLTDLMMTSIARLLPPSYQGVYHKDSWEQLGEVGSLAGEGIGDRESP